MTLPSLIAFAGIALIASYTQAVTGFAMGMIIMAIIGGFALVPLPVLTAAVSLMTFVNVIMALQGHFRHLHKSLYLWLAVGLVPANAVGVWLLNVLDSGAQGFLRILLGLFITFGSLSMLLHPTPRVDVSSKPARIIAGLSGGLVGGLFSASGPVMGWFVYRQPLSVASIRTTLLCCFGLVTGFRTLVVGASGGLTIEVWKLFGLALPAVAIGTWLGGRFPPRWGDAALKRAAFVILLATGLWILARVTFDYLS